MPSIVYSLRDPVAVCRLKAAFPSFVLTSATPSEVRSAVEAPGTLALVFGSEAVRDRGVRFFAGLRAHLLSMILVAYLRLAPNTAAMAFQLGQVGIDALCVRDVDDEPLLLRATLERALARVFGREVANRLRAAAPGLSTLNLEAALARISETKSARSLAESLGMDVRKLERILKRTHLPAPRTLLAWCKLLTAAKLLEDRARTIEAVALWLDYSSGPALRNACRKLVRATPTVIRESGGLTFAMRQFERALAKTG